MHGWWQRDGMRLFRMPGGGDSRQPGRGGLRGGQHRCMCGRVRWRERGRLRLPREKSLCRCVRRWRPGCLRLHHGRLNCLYGSVRKQPGKRGLHMQVVPAERMLHHGCRWKRVPCFECSHVFVQRRLLSRRRILGWAWMQAPHPVLRGALRIRVPRRLQLHVIQVRP